MVAMTKEQFVKRFIRDQKARKSKQRKAESQIANYESKKKKQCSWIHIMSQTKDTCPI